MRRTLLALSIAALLAGCGSDDDDDRPIVDGGGSGNPPVAEAIEITGAALAPGGMLSQVQPYSSFQVVMNFLISPAVAAITGLTGVADATVELYRVDNEGKRVGAVLDSTTTDNNGEYTLKLPEGEELGGDLVVEISSAGKSMRAQALADQVDVSPVSEFVMRKLIASDIDLKGVSAEAVIELTATIEALDLSAADKTIDDLVNELDAVAGVLLQEAIEIVTAQPGDASDLEGDYRNVAFQWGIDRGAQLPGGGFLLDTWITDMTLDAAGQGRVDLTITGEKDNFADLRDGGLLADSGSDTDEELVSFNIAANGTMSWTEAAEEETRGGDTFIEQSRATVRKFRKVQDRNIFILDATSTYYYYEPEDTDGDGLEELGGVVGHQVFRGIEFLAKKPTAADETKVSGDFGRVYIGTYLVDDGYREIEVEANIISFDGAGGFSMSASPKYVISRNGAGLSDFNEDASDEELGLTYALSADGRFTFSDEGGGPSDVFINDSFDLLAGTEFEWTDDSDETDGRYASVDHSATLAVKLPETMLSLDGRVYRIFQVENEFTDDRQALNTMLPASTLTMDSQTAATIKASTDNLSFGDNVIENDSWTIDATVALNSNGAVSIVVPDGDAEFTMKGFFNQSGSLAVLQTVQRDEGDIVALGVAVLLEITE